MALFAYALLDDDPAVGHQRLRTTPQEADEVVICQVDEHPLHPDSCETHTLGWHEFLQRYLVPGTDAICRQTLAGLAEEGGIGSSSSTDTKRSRRTEEATRPMPAPQSSTVPSASGASADRRSLSFDQAERRRDIDKVH
eukprot:CAMPEP_0115872926 /NCGR_PEP_ID=MMETSP0287-20121206/23701_1 /TAXON_ID=412157 /ORGANISM="Chrysochromulina rotalis, Strain UIO044" /LENGTH=138 /DNA_ID=CAMNT_0003327909 /DNA_START=484 /DNA_END=901 /DNA_ORIENTATION=+